MIIFALINNFIYTLTRFFVSFLLRFIIFLLSSLSGLLFLHFWFCEDSKKKLLSSVVYRFLVMRDWPEFPILECFEQIRKLEKFFSHET